MKIFPACANFLCDCITRIFHLPSAICYLRSSVTPVPCCVLTQLASKVTGKFVVECAVQRRLPVATPRHLSGRRPIHDPVGGQEDHERAQRHSEPGSNQLPARVHPLLPTQGDPAQLLTNGVVCVQLAARALCPIPKPSFYQQFESCLISFAGLSALF